MCGTAPAVARNPSAATHRPNARWTGLVSDALIHPEWFLCVLNGHSTFGYLPTRLLCVSAL